MPRLFYALWPDPVTRAALAERIPEDGGGHAVPPENLHLTLAFLGVCEAGQVEALRALGEGIVSPSFDLPLGEYGWFERAGALWLGADPLPAPLTVLQARLARGLASLGWTIPEPFVPHVTLRRGVRKGCGVLPPRPLCWTVRQWGLFESVGSAQGVRYRPLALWALPPAGPHGLPRLDEFTLWESLAPLPVALVMVGGVHCGACAVLARVLEALSSHKGWPVFEVDANEAGALVREWGVFHLPALYLFVNGVHQAVLDCEAREPSIIAAVEAALLHPAEEAP